jgi:hypothetical protein
MKNWKGLPIPFLIIILAGVVSLFSIFVNRNSSAKSVSDDSVQMQTVEQQRVAAIYFRILSWFSDFAPTGSSPAKAQPAKAPSQQHLRQAPSWCRPHPGRIELCRFHSQRRLATAMRQVW